jgi:hypothetical protein
MAKNESSPPLLVSPDALRSGIARLTDPAAYAKVRVEPPATSRRRDEPTPARGGERPVVRVRARAGEAAADRAPVGTRRPPPPPPPPPPRSERRPARPATEPARPAAPNITLTGIQDARWLRPSVATLLHEVPTAHGGVERGSISVPIAPSTEVTDLDRFQDPVDSSQFYHLPRYEVTTVPTSAGGHRFGVRIEVTEAGGRLTVALKARAPTFEGEDVDPGAPLPHDLALVLGFRIAPSPDSAYKELVFQEIRQEEDTIEGVLDLTDLELNAVYGVLRDPGRSPVLLARRSIQVAVPVPAAAPPSPGPGPGGPMLSGAAIAAARAAALSPDRLRRTATGTHRVRDHRRTDTPSTPPADGSTEPRFRETRRTLDSEIGPVPFAFEPDLHPYLFEGAAGVSGSAGGLALRQVAFGDGWASYYQDLDDPGLFYFLPDAFRIARRPEPPHDPFVVVSVAQAEDPGASEVYLTVVGAPHVDLGRLERARRDLTRHLPPGMRDHPGQVRLEPLNQPSSVLRTRLRAPLSDQLGDGVPVDLRTGFRLDLVLTLEQFQNLYDSLFTEGVSALAGDVDVPVGSEERTRERVPAEARFDRLSGPVFDVSPPVPQPDGTVRVRVEQAIESPISVDGLRFRALAGGAVHELELVALHRDEAEVPLPATLDPGSEIEATLRPPALLPEGEHARVTVLPDGLRVQVDRDAVTQAILDPTAPADYARPVDIFALEDWFDPGNAEDGDPIRVIVVELEGGTSVRLTRDDPEARGWLHRPLDELLNRATAASLAFRYRVTTVRGRGGSTLGSWIEHEGTMLYPRIAP